MAEIRKIAQAFFIIPDGRFVLQRRTKDAPNAPGLLGAFGGWIEDGETVQGGLIREINEETSLDTKNLRIELKEDFIIKANKDFGKDRHFYCFFVYIDSPVFEVHEGDGAEIYSLKELKSRSDLIKSTRYIVDNVL